MSEAARDHARETGPALEAHYRFLLWLVPAVERFPRSQKFLLGDRIQTTALDVLEALVEATYTKRRLAERHSSARSGWLRRAVVFGAVLMAVACAPGAVASEFVNPTGVALIIGNGDYEHRDVPDVDYAHRDADAFRHYVVDVLGYDPENVLDLRDATRRELVDALGSRHDPQSLLWSYLDPNEGSDVVVFYSGHGVPGVNDGRGYLLPVDSDPKAAEYDGYPIDLLYANLGKLREAKSVRVYLDTCFSGGSHGGGLIGNASPVYVAAALPDGVGEKVMALAAASGKQVASWDEEARHGLFTHHLLDALYGGGDGDGDGQVTAMEVKGYLDRHMTRAARRQHRRVQRGESAGGAGDRGGERGNGRRVSGASRVGCIGSGFGRGGRG